MPAANPWAAACQPGAHLYQQLWGDQSWRAPYPSRIRLQNGLKIGFGRPLTSQKCFGFFQHVSHTKTRVNIAQTGILLKLSVAELQMTSKTPLVSQS
jgi:hypothetical protein